MRRLFADENDCQRRCIALCGKGVMYFVVPNDVSSSLSLLATAQQVLPFRHTVRGSLSITGLPKHVNPPSYERIDNGSFSCQTKKLVGE